MAELWKNDTIKIIVAILVSVLGATGIQVAAPIRQDHSVIGGPQLIKEMGELKSEIMMLRFEMRVLKTQLPTQHTRERIEAIEDHLNSSAGYKPPHRRWTDQ